MPTLRSWLVTALDRPLLRPLLVTLANAYTVRLNRGLRLRVFYDRRLKTWGRRAPGEVILDGDRFSYDSVKLAMVGSRSPWAHFSHSFWLTRCPVQPGETVLDIGAEVGTDCSAFASAVGPTGRVIAIEAHPITFRLLEYTVKASPLRNVTAVNLAITGTPGTVWIEDGETTAGATVGTSGGASGHQVRAETLDTMAAELGVGDVGLLKMNIEGSERSALETLPDLLQRSRQVIVACHDFRAEMGHGEFYRTREFVRERLAAAGFTVAPTDHSAVAWARDCVVARRT
jgi:FkbM family methyltransferase